MAARENQALHIALIIFVILTLMLIVSTYYFFSNFQQERDKGKALAADNTKLTTDATTARNESAEYRARIGAEAKDNLEGVNEQAKKDMEAYGKGMPEASQNYRALVQHLASELAKAQAENNVVKAHEKELDDQLKAGQADKEKEIAEYTKKVSDTAQDLVDERAKFDKDRTDINKSKADLNQKFEAKAVAFDVLSKKSDEQIASLKADNAQVKKLLDDLHAKDADSAKRNEVPDGKIVKVDQRTRMVWINRGSADGLRRQTSFSVFDADDSNPLEGTLKGKIEVVRMINDRMAEARIVEDNLAHPMMFGDPIFSPSWEPGRAEHFALAGLIDLDDNGQSDLQRVRDMIAINGGVIDAEVDETGKRTGQMSINTKYLVLGKEPVSEGKINAYSDIRSEAQTLGVRTIPLMEFLDYMGFKAEERTVQLGKDAKGSDFKPRLPGGVQRVLPIDPTRERRNRPPTSQKIRY